MLYGGGDKLDSLVLFKYVHACMYHRNDMYIHTWAVHILYTCLQGNVIIIVLYNIVSCGEHWTCRIVLAFSHSPFPRHRT